MTKIRRNQMLCSIVLLSCLGGCADTSRIQRKDVSALYAEALTAANSQMQVETTAGIDAGAKNMIMPVSDEVLIPQEVEPPLNIAKLPPIPGSAMDSTATIGRVSANPVVYQPGMPMPGVGQLPPPIEPQRISEVFEETDVRQALQLLSAASGMTIIVDDQIGGVTSAQLNNVLLEDALSQILLPLGFVFVYRDGVYMVAPPNPASPLFSYVAKRFQYSPQHHPATELVELLPPRFKDFFQVSDERNIIIIDAPETIGQELAQRLQELDQPVEQVVLEAIVCVTSPESNFRFGMDWNHVVGVGGIDQLKIGMSGLAFNGSASPTGTDNAFSDFAVTSAFVRLLSQQGYVTIRAAPRVTAKDGEKATISIARETFFSLQPNNNQLLFNNNLQKVEAGISLIITPHVRGDLVAMEIEKAEVSEDIRTNEDTSSTSNTTFPIINRRQVSTKVDVRDGQTIVIGGLVQRQTVDKVNRIPLLGSLPGIGALFRTVEKQEREAEVAIFISPRIVPATTFTTATTTTTASNTVGKSVSNTASGAGSTTVTTIATTGSVGTSKAMPNP
ncbi:MAG: protein transporter [Pirellulaceae bacterium]|nr:protein transporter [Pirellulaceae bacterium]